MIRTLLDRLFPHDTLFIGGQPYMHRWYVFGYAPPEEEPVDKLQGFDSTPGAKRTGWRWQDYGLGAVRIHCTVASDDSRAFHDHPWPFLSLGIRGSYEEVTPTFRTLPAPDGGAVVRASTPDDPRNKHRVFRAPFLNRKRAEELHLLRVVDGPIWTLFLTRPKERSWGFAGPWGWLGWRDFDAKFPDRNAWTEAGS